MSKKRRVLETPLIVPEMRPLDPPKRAKVDYKPFEKKKKYKRSGHLQDQMLRYGYPKDNQLDLFTYLQETTIKEIRAKGNVEITEIVEGIKLSSSEQKVVDCLSKLLYDKSQTKDPKKDNYYTGNKGYQIVTFGKERAKAPNLTFTLYELTKEYKGKERVGGKDLETVRNILGELNKRHFLLRYVEKKTKKDGGRTVREIEGFKKLIEILTIRERDYDKKNIMLSSREETAISLNPIFISQIDSKYILYPEDINRRTMIAYGGQKISIESIRLRDYLIREISSKRYEPEITLDRLYYLLSEKSMKAGRKKRVKEYTAKAIETCKNLGLIESFEIQTAATGEPKIIFTLNKEWE